MISSVESRADTESARVLLILAGPVEPAKHDAILAAVAAVPGLADVHVRTASAGLECELETSGNEIHVVLDPARGYAPSAVAAVVEAVAAGRAPVAIAVGPRPPLLASPRKWLQFLVGQLSWVFLGTAELFSGLFAADPRAWTVAGLDLETDPGLMIGRLLGQKQKSLDVVVPVGESFEAHPLEFSDLRPLKRLLDGRYGNFSRLVQFCIVGASGMVIDLSMYALLQFLLRSTSLAGRHSTAFGLEVRADLAIAGAIAIATALVWNFSLNRRLTFNDARDGAILPQFFKYVLSNAIAILLSFSVRVYLPEQVQFFDRHKLAAAVVGIVAATGISFSMSRWLVFSRKSLPQTALEPAVETSSV